MSPHPRVKNQADDGVGKDSAAIWLGKIEDEEKAIDMKEDEKHGDTV